MKIPCEECHRQEDCPVWLCSICGKEKGTDIIWDDYPNYVVGEMQPRDQRFYGYNYCPECGQKIKWGNDGCYRQAARNKGYLTLKVD